MRCRCPLLLELLLFLCLAPLACGRRGEPPRESAPASTPTGATENSDVAPTNVSGRLVYEQLEIGQGDAELIVSPDGRAMLVDGGPPGRAPAILDALREHGVERLDLVVASHPHNDHIGSLDDIVGQVPVGQFLDSGFEYGSAAQRRLLLTLKQRRVPFKLARPGQEYSLGDEVAVAVLAPRTPLLKGTESDPNNNSVVLKVTYGGVRILLTGDLEEDGRRRLFEDGADLAAEIYKVSHHGSHNGTDDELMHRVRPRVAILSCEAGNDYGHPHVETLQALSSAGAAIYRTDLHGRVTLTSDGKTWDVRTARQATIALTTPGRQIRGGGGDRATARDPSMNGGGRTDPATKGKIVGNRRSKVYHVGESGRLPSPQNRVYFRSEAEARQSGYRPATGKE